jgi:hypothetical protein
MPGHSGFFRLSLSQPAGHPWPSSSSSATVSFLRQFVHASFASAATLNMSSLTDAVKVKKAWRRWLVIVKALEKKESEFNAPKAVPVAGPG